MKICGIIAEYNPFHKGHIYHLTKCKEITQADCIVVIVSGYFSQRGLPSYLNKEDKTRLALAYGADLVLELPVCYAAQGADFFAKYAIESLHELGIDSLCFGSETNDIAYLRSIEANDIDPSTSYQRNNTFLKPNDILAAQYIKYCDMYKIEPISTQRNDAFKSATQTRKDALSSSQDFQEFFHTEENWNHLYPYLKMALLMTKPDMLSTFFLVNEGIEYRLIKNAKEHNDFESFLNGCISKTYSKARIQRTCLMILLQITKKEMEINNHFSMCKVLGFNSIGQQVLKTRKDKNIYTKFNELPDFIKEIDRKSRDLYNLIYDGELDDKKVVIYDC